MQMKKMQSKSRQMCRKVLAGVAAGLMGLALLQCGIAPAAAADFRVNTTTYGGQVAMYTNRTVAMDSAGNFVISWVSTGEDREAWDIYAQRYNSSGVPQGSEFRVNSTTTSHFMESSVAMDSVGNFVVTWHSSHGSPDGYNIDIYAKRYNSSGVALGSEFRVNTYTTSDQTSPSVAMDSAGNFVITWDSNGQDGSEGGIYAKRYNSSGVPQGSDFRVNTYTTSSQTAPSVAMNGAGNFVVTWESGGQDGSLEGVYAQRYNSSGVAQGSEFRVNTTTTDSQENPSMAIDSAGNFIISWHSRALDMDLRDADIYAQRYNSSGVPQGSEFRVNTYTTSTQFSPSVAMDSVGNFVVTWHSHYVNPDGTGDVDIYAQRYNSSGVPQGSEFRVNTYTTSSQAFASVAMDGAGNFVVSWQSSQLGPYGTDDVDIYAVRFIVNNSKVVAATDTATLNEDSSTVINVLANDTGSNLSVTGSTAGAHGSTQGTFNGVVSASGPWNGIRYTPNPDYFGTDTFTYTISNGNGGTATGTVNITVRSVNDAPSFTKGADQTINEDAGMQTVTGWTTDLSRGAANEAAQTLKFTVSATNTALFATRPQVSPTGTLTYRSALNKHGSATVTVTLRDSGGTLNGGIPNSAPQTFTVLS
jgi:hypothetical protein